MYTTHLAASENGSRKAGVIWHTQGSGKSYSMLMYTRQLVLELNNPTIVVITDRNDLDDQLFTTFSKVLIICVKHPSRQTQERNYENY